MGSIEKLSIRGIRSFSPDRDETIEFYSPLTMIVGANGCGKTTIIEALKFICTGSLPPNSSKGQSFVNDPTVTDSTEVKANIKLRFQNKAGYASVVTRSLQVTKKKSKLEYKALDGVIKTTNADNEKVSSSQKCSDLDRMVPEMLGVSAPILENVIFCHQEDSNWPMQEGLILKKKFDDVFESTRYSKALEAIMKTKKEFQDKAKDLKADVAEYGAHYHASTETRQEIARCEENMTSCTREMEVNQERLDRLQEKVTHSQQMIQEYQEYDSKQHLLSIRIEESNKRLLDRKATLPIIYEGENIPTLMNRLHNFDDVIHSQTQEIKRYQSQIETINTEISMKRQNMDEFNRLKGQADSILVLITTEKSNVWNECKVLSREHNVLLNFTNDTWNVQLGKEFIKSLENKIISMQKAGDESMVEDRKLLQIKDTEVQTKQQSVHAYELQINTKKYEIERLNKEIQQKQLEISTHSGSSSGSSNSGSSSGNMMQEMMSMKFSMNQLQEELSDIQTLYNAFMETYTLKSNEYKTIIKDSTNRIRELTELITGDASKLQEMNMMKTEMLAISTAEKQRQQELIQIQQEAHMNFYTHKDILKYIDSTLDSSFFLPPSSSSMSISASTSTTNNSSQSVIDFSMIQALSSKIDTMYSSDKQKVTQLRTEWQEIKSRKVSISSVLMQEKERYQQLQVKLNQLQQEKNTLMTQYVQEFNVLRESPILDGEYEGEDDLYVHSCTPEMLLQYSENLVSTTLEYKTASRDVSTYLKKLEKMRTKVNGACPCCEQTMNDVTVQKYTQNINKLFHLSILKQSIENYEHIYDQSILLHNKIRTMDRIISSIETVEKDIRILNESIQNKDIQVKEQEIHETTSQQKYETAENLYIQVEKVYHVIKDISNRWHTLQMKIREIHEKKKRQLILHQSTLEMTSLPSDMDTDIATTTTTTTTNNNNILSQYQNIEQLEELQQQRQDEKEKEINKKDKATNDENNLTKKYYYYKNLVQEKEIAYQDVQRKYKLIEDNNTQIQVMSTQVESLEKELVTVTQSLQYEKTSYDQLHNEYKAVQIKIQNKEKEINTRIQEFKNKLHTLSRSMDTIQDLTHKYTSMNITNMDKEIQEIMSEISRKEGEIKTILPHIERIQKELSQQDDTKRIVQANIDYLQAQNTHTILLQEKTQLNDQWNQYKQIHHITSNNNTTIEDLSRELQRSTQEKNKIQSDIDKLKGNLENYHIQLYELNKKINGPLYKGIKEKYHCKTIEYETTNLAVADLGSYYDALDQALQNFHVLKIREINKIIRELWQLIYKGQDIDMIEIESGQEAETATTRGKRSYNYRVVMRKNGVPLDMRGRCSAGQKVLAAIVIRLALAETFCLSCGILALDEPTTNLDDANKEGLAHALARIIQDRAIQHNFQLICITHDEEFVRMMNTELSTSTHMSLPEYYFRISREDINDQGRYFTRIDRIRWEDM